MATINKIKITKNCSGNPCNYLSAFEKGVLYLKLIDKSKQIDLVQFSINEMPEGTFWNVCFGFASGTAKSVILNEVQEYVKKISIIDINLS